MIRPYWRSVPVGRSIELCYLVSKSVKYLPKGKAEQKITVQGIVQSIDDGCVQINVFRELYDLSEILVKIEQRCKSLLADRSISTDNRKITLASERTCNIEFM
jgi:hypothetical protein